jgi:hypothetical protein
LGSFVLVLLEHFLILFKKPVQFNLLHFKGFNVIAQSFDSLALLANSLFELLLLLGFVAKLSKL